MSIFTKNIFKTVGFDLWFAGWDIWSFGVELEINRRNQLVSIDVGPLELMIGRLPWRWRSR